jgi:1-acyl-sn-glycerol-3-phosphate acyltransferase
VFAVAPEGTRSKTGGLARGKSGVVYIAQHAGVPIVPVAHFGTERVTRTWLQLRRPEVTVRVGRLFTLPPLASTERSTALREQTDLVMCHIAALLPPEYRGVYADHPELRKLLAKASPA